MWRKPISVYCKFNGCKVNSSTEGAHFYKFPKEEERCQAWVKACQNSKLFGIPASQLCRTARICDNHFHDWCFMNITDKHRLVHNAVPCCDKPQPKRESIFSLEENLKDCIEFDHNYISHEECIVSSQEPNIISKADCLVERPHLDISSIPLHNTSFLSLQNNKICNIPKSHPSSVGPKLSDGPVSCMEVDHHSSSPREHIVSPVSVQEPNIVSESASSVESPGLKISVIPLDNASVLSRSIYMFKGTPLQFLGKKYSSQTNKSKARVKKYCNLSRRLKSKSRSSPQKRKKRISPAKSLKLILDKLRVSEEFSHFIQRQVKLHTQSENSRRFTEHEKKLASRIFCKSRAAYRVLREILILPSERTLIRFASSKLSNMVNEHCTQNQDNLMQISVDFNSARENKENSPDQAQQEEEAVGVPALEHTEIDWVAGAAALKPTEIAGVVGAAALKPTGIEGAVGASIMELTEIERAVRQLP